MQQKEHGRRRQPGKAAKGKSTAWQHDRHHLNKHSIMRRTRGAHLGPAVDAGAQAERDEALEHLRQLAVLQVVVEHAGRARVAQQVRVALLQPRRREAPVPLRRPLRAP